MLVHAEKLEDIHFAFVTVCILNTKEDAWKEVLICHVFSKVYFNLHSVFYVYL